MEKKDRNAKPGDNEIVTKKGFLISPPKRVPSPKPSFLMNKSDAKEKPAENKKENNNKDTARENNPANNNAEKKNFDKKNGKKHFGGNKNADKRDNKIKESEKNNAPEQNKNNAPVVQKENKENKENSDNRKNNGKKHKNGGENKNHPQEQTSEKNHNNNHAKGGKNEKRRDKNEQRENDQRKNGKEKDAGRIVPSVLGDLGFVSDAFKKRSGALNYSTNEDDTPEEKIDYSKAIPLRDQIYPPKKEKKVLSEQEKEGKTEIIGIRFKEAGKIYYFDPDGKEVPYGTPVIVETARGLEYGYTAISNRFIPVDAIVTPLKKIIRLATNEDKERLDANKLLEKQAEGVFVEKVEKLGLAMSLVGVEYTFDNTKLLFYFAAENRIDFRELVKELAAVFRTRIELRQVGVRDEAKMLGGLGVCGRPLCCNTFLGEFAQVSIKMAKDQSLSLSSSKISGTCGRLLCCLRYEDEVYQQEYERTPKVDAIVETPEGKGVVVETNPLKGIVRVRMDDRKEAPPQAFHRDSVKIVGYLKNNKNNDEDLAELKELEKE